MARSMEEWLEFYKEMLSEELEKDNTSPSGICMFASAIARILELSDRPEEANKFFSMAGRACLDDLEHVTGPTQTTPRGRGDDRLRCGQILWRAGDDRAVLYIQQALEAYREGYYSGMDVDRASCWSRSAYCLIFLEEYGTALEAIRKSLELKMELTHPVKQDPSEILIEILESIEEGEKATFVETVSRLETFLKRRRISLYGMNPPFIVDVYELLRRRSKSIQ